jgi:hypothetical protein
LGQKSRQSKIFYIRLFSSRKGGKMREQWRMIEDFPSYSISNFGEVAKWDNEQHPLRQSPNTYGLPRVGLFQDRQQFTKLVARLVAEAFIQRDREYFDTPINLDGDRTNNRADNLMWRPRWFAIKYHQQFEHDQFHDAHPNLEIVNTGERFRNLKDPSIKYGLLYLDIIKSAINEDPIFPTGQQFIFI